MRHKGIVDVDVDERRWYVKVTITEASGETITLVFASTLDGIVQYSSLAEYQKASGW